VKSVDGTSLESTWSEPVPFYTGFAFSLGKDGVVSLPVWVVFILAGIGVLLVVLLGFWLGGGPGGTSRRLFLLPALTPAV